MTVVQEDEKRELRKTNEPFKLWHDDVRQPPRNKDWIWVKNNDEAKIMLESGGVVEISMDHDLGADPGAGIFARGESEDNGMELVKWMCERMLIPNKIRIHSWNAPAAKRMAEYFESYIKHHDLQMPDQLAVVPYDLEKDL